VQDDRIGKDRRFEARLQLAQLRRALFSGAIGFVLAALRLALRVGLLLCNIDDRR
jgi:hypothetical protein